MKSDRNRFVAWILGIPLLCIAGGAHADCKSVDGNIVSRLVTEFSNGDPCPSVLELCTEGRFSGDLKGRFRFVADSLTPFALLDPTSPPDVAATTGRIILRPKKLCDGTLLLRDTSAFSLSPDGFVGGLETVDGDASTGGCSGASGRIRLEGVFQEGCVDCRYRGEICGLDLDDDEDDDDD